MCLSVASEAAVLLQLPKHFLWDDTLPIFTCTHEFIQICFLPVTKHFHRLLIKYPKPGRTANDVLVAMKTVFLITILICDRLTVTP